MFLNIDNYDNYIFDCDGVILDSNNIKTESFQMCLLDEDEDQRKSFMEYHRLNTGVSRYEKFQNYFVNIKKESNYRDKLDFFLKKFSFILKNALLESLLTEGTTELLDLLMKKNKNLYVVSASDEKELLDLFKQRKLTKYFNKILGSPKNKIENINYLKKTRQISQKTVFFGDSRSDYQAALHFSFDFIYLKKYSLWEVPADIANNKDFMEISDFSKLKIIQ